MENISEKRTALKIKDDIYWVGALDYDIRVFDIIMTTEYGTTYNSYIVKGTNKTALIETVKQSFFDEFAERLSDVCNPREIDYIVLNHTEPDHSGSVARLAELNPDVTVVGTRTALMFLKNITNTPFKEMIVKDGDYLDLGGKTLRFISAPFLHWPDSMFTYCQEVKTLFTCDSFGCHYCSDQVFNDAIGSESDFTDAYKYYFDCIMGPFKSFVLDALNKIKGLDIEVISTGHGPVLRTGIQKYLDMYEQWAQTSTLKTPIVTIAYVSAYGYTRKLAESIAEGVRSACEPNALPNDLPNALIETHLYDLVTADFNEVMAKISASEGILIGSPTLVGDTLPPIWNLLSHLNPIIHKDKIAGVFGSYGWSGEAIPNIEGRLGQLRLKMPLPSLKICFNPSEAQLKEAFDFGKNFAEFILKNKR